MAPTIEWDLAYDLHGPHGILEFNAATSLGTEGSGVFRLHRQGCQMISALRVTSDDAPQQDGSIPHPAWWSGMRTTLVFSLWKNDSEIACGDVARAMNDVLMRHLLPLKAGGGRLVWVPSGAVDRMVDQLWMIGEPTPTQDSPSDELVTYSVLFVSPFPYAMTAAEVTTSITDGNDATLDNVGTIEFFPVMKVYGPTSAFTIRNQTSGLEMVYNAGLPGASAIGGSGAYVELDFFRNTAYLNGNGPSRKAGINVLASDFFTLDPGPNLISIVGADVDVLWQPAWG